MQYKKMVFSGIGFCLLLVLYYGVWRQPVVYPVTVISSFHEFAMADACDTQTMIFFDVDDTLIHHPNIFPRDAWQRWLLWLRIVLKHPEFLKQAVWEHYYSIAWKEGQQVLIEPDIPTFICQLQEKSCAVFALTAMETGTFGVIPDTAVWRYLVLAKLGIIFTQTFGNHIFDASPSYRGNLPLLYNGIICTNHLPKGQV